MHRVLRTAGGGNRYVRVVAAVVVGCWAAGAVCHADVSRDAVILAERVEERIEDDEPDEVQAVIAQYHRNSGGDVVVVDTDTRLLAHTGAPPPAIPDELRAALTNRHTSGRRDGQLYIAVPAVSGEQVRGAIRISYPTTTIDEAVNRIWGLLAGIGLAVLLATAAAAIARISPSSGSPRS